jgi:hypothetical protein
MRINLAGEIKKGEKGETGREERRGGRKEGRAGGEEGREGEGEGEKNGTAVLRRDC